MTWEGFAQYQRFFSSLLKAKIVLSPISALELMSQLCDDSAAQAFAAVQAMWNWLPDQVSILDIPPIFIREGVTGHAEDAQTTFERISNALTRSIHSRSAASLREVSKELRNYLQRSRLSDAQTRRDAVVHIRENLRTQKRRTITEEELRSAFRNSIAVRAKVEPSHAGVSIFAARVEAYYQHETVRLKRAIENPKMNLVSKKRQNDLFDTEQLLYLAVPELCFLSTDGRAYAHLQDLEQGRRIYLAQPESLASFAEAQDVLRHATAEP
jgi:hypothetical protein